MIDVQTRRHFFKALGLTKVAVLLPGCIMDSCRAFKGWAVTLLLASMLITCGTYGQEYDEAAIVSARLDLVDPAAMRLVVRDLMKSHPESYTNGSRHLKQIDRIAKKLPEIKKALVKGTDGAIKQAESIIALKQSILLANPLLDFEKLLVVKRVPVGDPRRSKYLNHGLGEFIGLPRQSSWQIDRIPKTHGWENEISILSPLNPNGKLKTLYAPDEPKLVGDIELNFDGDKLMFSMPGPEKTWQVFEMDMDDTVARQLTPKKQTGVHNFDAFYMPDGRIGFISTAAMQGVPCNTSVNVGMLFNMQADGSNVNQLCFDQDHNYSPTLMNDGRVLYLRWEYTDLPHVWGRYLFTMNPDGTSQRHFYGTGSYWPNGIFYARPIPGHPTKVVGIITGHHVGRAGEMVIFDPAKAPRSVGGVVQKIPGRGKKVEPVIEDRLTIDVYPKFLHPYPLSDKYFIVAAKPTELDLWGIYLVDTFDNMTLIHESEGSVLLEPIPLVKRKKPPVIIDRSDPASKDAIMYIENVYAGPGLKDVPIGSVKKLRLFSYHFAYQKLAGITHRIGTDGPWEPKRVLGTVDVEKDGSVMFQIPAKVPISIQPLDADGKAIQLMRSWTTAMGGEFVSCVGCHETQSQAAMGKRTIAARKAPVRIKPWHGPVRGFNFTREVQPVLDKYCVSCHNPGKSNGSVEQFPIPDFTSSEDTFKVLKNNNPEVITVTGVDRKELVKKYGGVFPPSYVALRAYVRVGGFESDIHLLNPAEFGAGTSELFQILKKGHYGVELDEEAWGRLATWIDLNAPCHGTWREAAGLANTSKARDYRADLRKLYAGINENSESYPSVPKPDVKPVQPAPYTRPQVRMVNLKSWPLDANEAKRRQYAFASRMMTVDLADGTPMEFVLIPAGDFVIGDSSGNDDELPLTHVKIEKSFWMSKFEVTNAQYNAFNADHNSRYEHKGSWQFSEKHLGWPLNTPDQPVVRVSWNDAQGFCDYISAKTGKKASLPTEAQWEYACRAGTNTPFNYGGLDTDFSTFANMSDATIRELAFDTDGRKTADILPRDARFNDTALVTVKAGSYKPNRWGLHDMHGNVWEWTQSKYTPYPYLSGDGRNDSDGVSQRVVRGGSWYDRPKRCRSGYRLSYPAWQKIYNVGLRIVIEAEDIRLRKGWATGVAK
ncbi:MAG: SUMF1/EgtB/PvdO family nonheme iron enzyme [Planctomycetes bacterium]|nr:SUMF1/EgtB/PvdO family nonheme iron enzyme [Planctomycetota bacterium]